jgi:hypothetical protein
MSVARRAVDCARVGALMSERRRDFRDVAPIHTFPVHTTFARPVTVQAGDTERLSLFPPREITLPRDPVGLFGLSPNRRTPCVRPMPRPASTVLYILPL